MKQWYESLFENYGLKYDNECFTQGTSGECDFLEKEIAYNRQMRILDIGCGTGRHSIEMAKRGYNLTGIDLSDSQLARAIEKAAEQKVNVDFQKRDARELPFEAEFDLAIMLCEGAFPLMETDEMNYQILAQAAKALKPGGKLIFTTLNGLFPLFHSVKDFLASAKLDGNASYEGNSFDLMTFRDFNVTTFEDDNGKQIELHCNERYYVPSEISWLLKTLGFKSTEMFGAVLGDYGRQHKLTPDDFEMLVVAVKA